MKKFLSVVLCFVCILSFAFPVSAFSFDDSVLNGVELSAIRLSASILHKTKFEIADEILLAIGLGEEFIETIPDSKKMEIANSVSVQFKTEYSKINSLGVEIKLTEDEFNNELNLINKNSKVGDLSFSHYQRAENPLHYDDEDDYLIKNIYIFETKNAPKGTYAIMVTYDWKNYSTRWHGEDVIGISGEEISFDRSSFYFYGSYAYSQTTSIGTNVGQDYIEVDSTSLDDSNDLKIKDNGITYQFNLKNNIWSPVAPLIYTQARFIMMASSRVIDWTSPKTFNIFSSYFHQHIGLGSVGVSVNINGADISVSPQLVYTECQISTEHQINYVPN